MRIYAIFEVPEDRSSSRQLVFATTYLAEAGRLSEAWHSQANEFNYEVEQSDDEGIFLQSKIIIINGELV